MYGSQKWMIQWMIGDLYYRRFSEDISDLGFMTSGHTSQKRQKRHDIYFDVILTQSKYFWRLKYYFDISALGFGLSKTHHKYVEKDISDLNVKNVKIYILTLF